ncbi:phosphate--AMP phosphotransferase [Tannockella kyphosi]|uniref:phosphate--AMP phosphotransferase n=1 Tax=Tannockella kyphosi TaxID=2899121 RepID=UPI0020130E6C|nr:phosphate--AMP phosphotransferase [Tannockella kyphosi]
MFDNKENEYALFTTKEKKKLVKEKQKELGVLQRTIFEKNIPTVVILEGWSASGKGRILGKIISQLEPRHYQVHSSKVKSIDELRRPLFWRFFIKLPLYGKMVLFDRGWYNDVFEQLIDGASQEQWADKINRLEAQLVDDGTIVMKFFLHISKKEQAKRLKELDEDQDMSWRIVEKDWNNHKQYDQRKKLAEDFFSKTNTSYAPWHIVFNEDKYDGVLEVLDTMIKTFQDVLENGLPITTRSNLLVNHLNTPYLQDVSLRPYLTEEQYKQELKKEQDRLTKIQNLLYRNKIPVVLAFEGWDAAGKGGAIRRLSWALDPRGFDVIPVASPTKEELMHHYLWRFYKEIPKVGHIAIFDRTWYGRVMVEKLEDLTDKKRCEQAYNEINEFEDMLHSWGAVVLKFWIQIDKEEQYTRFMTRVNTPEKNYKITDEDWRNREKWDVYEEAVNTMIQRTSTHEAPWIIIEGNDKMYARIKVLRTIREKLEEEIKNRM